MGAVILPEPSRPVAQYAPMPSRPSAPERERGAEETASSSIVRLGVRAARLVRALPRRVQIVGASIVLLLIGEGSTYVVLFNSGDRPLRRHQREFVDENCPDITWDERKASSLVADCYAKVEKRNEARPAAKTAHVAPADTPTRTVVGDVGTLQGLGGASFVYLFASYEDFDEMSKAVVAKDIDGWKQIRAEKGTPVASSTKAREIDSKWSGSVRVRVVDGPNAGFAGWTYREELEK